MSPTDRAPGWLLPRLEARQRLAVRDVGLLRPYQRDVLIPFLSQHPFSGGFVDLGLGKTVSVLSMLSHEFEHGRIKKALVIAPLRVAVQTWPTELREWSHTWWMSHTLIRATGIKDVELQRRRLARSPAMIHLINREMVHWLVDFWGARWPYDCVIVDESTSFSDHRTKRWRALNKVRSRITRLHLLSGIPAPEGIEDYFAQIYLLDRGERFGRGITHFRERYLIQNPYTRRWTARPGADKEVAEKIGDICMVMREEDYLDISKPVIVERPIVLDPAQLKQYKAFERTLILPLPDIEIEAENGAALAQKLLQYASGAVYDAERRIHEVHSHKLDELTQLREEAQGSPLLVAYWHRSSLLRIRKLFPKAVVMDKQGDCVADWNKGKIDMLLIHPASAGHGLNMQLGPGHILVFFDNLWSLELHRQTIARIARSGQRRLVRVYHLVAQGTLDATVVPVLLGKHDAQDAVRRYIRDVRNRMENVNGA